MTRFTRAAGSKSSNEKIPEEATSWHVMKQQLQAKYSSSNNSERVAENEGKSGKGVNVSRKDKFVGNKTSIWAEFNAPTHDCRNTTIDSKNLTSSVNKSNLTLKANPMFDAVNGSSNIIDTKLIKKRRNGGNNPATSTSCSSNGPSKRVKIKHDDNTNDFNNVASFQGFNVKREDAKRLKLLKQQLFDSNLGKEEVEMALKQERRKAEKALARDMKQICFNCRKPGHTLSNCSNLKNSGTQESMLAGICFKCGSTEHKLSQCRVSGPQEFQYANCFICKQQGHIAKECPDNPRGLYPHGGACKVCGDVTHLKKDCPKVVCKNNDPKFMLAIINENSVEGLDEDIQESLKTKKKAVKQRIIKF